MIVVGIDPGVRCSGVAWLEIIDGRCIQIEADAARVAKNVPQPLAWNAMGEAIYKLPLFNIQARIDHLVLEVPKVYDHGPGDDSDLISLGGVLGAAMARLRFNEVTQYRPREWKGTVDPDVMTQRLQKRYAGVDIAHVIPSLRHNTLDAIGLAMHHAKMVLRRTPELALPAKASVI